MNTERTSTGWKGVLSKLGLGGGRDVVFEPRFNEQCVLDEVATDLARYLGVPSEDVMRIKQRYVGFHREKNYAGTLGERKTLCCEEAFVLYAVLSYLRPETVVEIGTHFGRSTRRLIDMRASLECDYNIVCYDVIDVVNAFDKSEVDLRLEDVTGDVKAKVFDAHKPGLVYLDAHPYALLKSVISTYLQHETDSVLAVHDCGRGLCNPNMTLGKDEEVTSTSGVWERHVLAEVLGVDGATSPRLDDLETETHRLHIFDTPHGLALLLPKKLTVG